MDIERSLLNPEEFNNSRDSSSNDTVIANSDAKMNDLDKLKAEFLAFKMFATEQFYLLKQSTGIPKQTTHSEIYINYLNEQIQYLKEENKTKNSIIQSLVQHSYNSNDLLFRKGDNYDKNNQKISPVDSTLDERSPLAEVDSNEQKHNEDENIDNEEVVLVTQKDQSNDQDRHMNLNQNNITKRKPKKKKRDHNEGIDDNDKNKQRSNTDNKANDNNNITSPSKSKETVFILGDSMVKKVNGFHLTKHIRHKYLVKVRSFSSAKTRCMHDHVKPTMRDFDPEHVIIHVGTNDLNSNKTASQIANSIVELVLSLKNDRNSIYVSLIVPRNDNLNNKVNEVNTRLTNLYNHRGIPVINHTDTIDPGNHLNESQIHLNRYGNIEFTKNFKKFMFNLD